MTYRDDREADQARIAALEAELASARERIAELEGRRDQALAIASGNALMPSSRAGSRAERWLGAPLKLQMSRTFLRAYPIERLEELLPRVRAITDEIGTTELLRSSLTWRTSGGQRQTARTTVNVVVHDGMTTLTVSDSLHQLAGALYGGIGGGMGGGGVAAPVFASMAIPVLAPLFFVGWLGGVYGGTRLLFKRMARKRAALVRQLFDALSEEIEAATR